MLKCTMCEFVKSEFGPSLLLLVAEVGMDDLASALRNAHRCSALGIEAALHLDAEIAIFATVVVVVVLIFFLNTLDGDAVVGWRTVVLDTLPYLTALLAIQVVLGNMNLLIQVVAACDFRGDDDLVIDSVDYGVAARTTGSTGRASWTARPPTWTARPSTWTARPTTRTTRFARWIKWSASSTATSSNFTACRKV